MSTSKSILPLFSIDLWCYLATSKIIALLTFWGIIYEISWQLGAG